MLPDSLSVMRTHPLRTSETVGRVGLEDNRTHFSVRPSLDMKWGLDKKKYKKEERESFYVRFISTPYVPTLITVRSMCARLANGLSPDRSAIPAVRVC